MTNSAEIPLGISEEELIKKNTQLNQEKEMINNKLQTKEKEIKELQRKIESLSTECEHQKELTKNAESLLSFYKNQISSSSTTSGNSPESDIESKMKDLEIKILSYEESQKPNLQYWG